MTFEEVLDDALAVLQRRGLTWTGASHPSPPPVSPPAPTQERAPLSYTPAHLTEKILDALPSLEGERKQVTVLLRTSKPRWGDSPSVVRRRPGGPSIPSSNG